VTPWALQASAPESARSMQALPTGHLVKA
jgi:hypothetical protein